MNIKKFLVGTAAGALMLGALAVPAFATDGNGKNVGTATDLSGVIYDADGNSAGYTCDSVHRTVVAGGFQDKQSCVLDAGATLPIKSMTVSKTLDLSRGPAGSCSWDDPISGPTYHDYTGANYNETIWYSDYTYMTLGTFETAQSWSYKITPTGAINIVAFFPTSTISDPCY